MDNASIELLRKNMDTVILRSLYDDSKYGLEIYNFIKNSSNDLYTLKHATMYKTLKKLEEEGLIISSPGNESNGAKRVYFSLTAIGREQLNKSMKEWEFSRTIMDTLVSNKVFNPADTDAPFDLSKLRPKTKRKKSEVDAGPYADNEDRYNVSNTQTFSDESNCDNTTGDFTILQAPVNFASDPSGDLTANIIGDNNRSTNGSTIENYYQDNIHVDNCTDIECFNCDVNDVESVNSNSKNSIVNNENVSNMYRDENIELQSKFAIAVDNVVVDLADGVSSEIIIANHDDDILSDAMIAENEQKKIILNTKFSFDNLNLATAQRDGMLTDTEQKIVVPTIKNSDDYENEERKAALFALFSDDYKPKNTKEYNRNSVVNNEANLSPTPYNFSSDEIIKADSLRSTEEIKSAALKLYDRNYNSNIEAKSIYTAPIINTENKDLTHFNTEIRIKDPLTPDQKRKIFDDFMSAESVKTPASAAETYYNSEQTKNDIMTANVENNRIKSMDNREKSSILYNYDIINSSVVQSTMSPKSTVNQQNNVDSLNSNSTFQNFTHDGSLPKNIAKFPSDPLSSGISSNDTATVDKSNATYSMHSNVYTSVTPNQRMHDNQDSVNYIDKFDKIFKTKRDVSDVEDLSEITSTENKLSHVDFEEMSFGRMKSKLAVDNIKLKPYVKINTSKYYVGRFFHSNKLLRDWSYITFAIYLIYSITIFITANAITSAASSISLLVTIIIGLALPIVTTALWINDKTKRKRNNFNLVQALITSIITLMIALLIIILVAILGVKINFDDIKTYFEPLVAPIIALLILPLSVVIYYLLFNSKRYHIK